MNLYSALYQTDQIRCYDVLGQEIDCTGTGQDGDIRAGLTWPIPRFEEQKAVVIDCLSGLLWTKNATPAEFPQTWEEAIEYVNQMNASCVHGHEDWRLPNRRELFSLISHSQINPALPAAHPFTSVFSGYYWTSNSCAQWPKQAWYVHLGGGRVFKGMKQGSYLVWPVRRLKSEKPKAPGVRFETSGHLVSDRSTGLVWLRSARGSKDIMDWPAALIDVQRLNANKVYGHDDWRLPNIRELESLVALDQHSPALPATHPFKDVAQGYWSSTTSVYDPTYAWVLYTDDGNVGVGFKEKADFSVWPVRNGVS
jgi:hypothetical protein